ncbi:MAG: hypothetical protein A2600_07825 [Candidatus Lambdaproteobacteria bacterium RIFOXYD1_FULL_56_27]|nr:MAG: hypothetical protein A2426_09780 [Candidatus Lambdaproteobacteria bacterium RIFOXYC1_FULL_56_13]OGH09681.1 MAG: hypothetical protein A2600_07825 [Candidatus Lambdaproteobacteria bacterium RIFOXYD1_FULL_56_27]
MPRLDDQSLAERQMCFFTWANPSTLEAPFKRIETKPILIDLIQEQHGLPGNGGRKSPQVFTFCPQQ